MCRPILMHVRISSPIIISASKSLLPRRSAASPSRRPSPSPPPSPPSQSPPSPEEKGAFWRAAHFFTTAGSRARKCWRFCL